MAEQLGEKTEAPTSKRLSDARQRGQIAKSTDLTSAMLLLAILIMLLAIGSAFIEQSAGLIRTVLGGELIVNDSAVGVPGGVDAIRQLLALVVRMAWPALAIAFVIAYIVHFVQVGWLLSAKPLEPKFKQFDIIKGIGKIFTKKNMVKGVVNVGKLGFVGSVGVLFVRANMREVASLPMLHITGGVAVMSRLILELALWCLLLLLILGVIDYMYQRWQHHEDLKMTKQEVKDERKNMDGDPYMKRRQLEFGRDILNQQIRKTVPEADVVVTNPTHYAVALKYEHGLMHAPRVVAKGADFMAMQIRYIAAANGVPIIERPPLARALYNKCEIGQEIPVDQYEAVAELLAYVYRLEGRMAS
jgi:flagellar biosynthetic protein FlhB